MHANYDFFYSDSLSYLFPKGVIILRDKLLERQY